MRPFEWESDWVETAQGYPAWLARQHEAETKRRRRKFAGTFCLAVGLASTIALALWMVVTG